MIAPPEPLTAPPRLLDRVRWHLRVKHYSLRTERVYIDRIRRFILFHGKRHPSEMDETEVTAFLTSLAVEKHVAASTQNQALSALLFLYQQVLERKLDFMDKIERVTRPPKIPVVFTRNEARAVLDQLRGSSAALSSFFSSRFCSAFHRSRVRHTSEMAQALNERFSLKELTSTASIGNGTT